MIGHEYGQGQHPHKSNLNGEEPDAVSAVIKIYGGGFNK